MVGTVLSSTRVNQLMTERWKRNQRHLQSLRQLVLADCRRTLSGFYSKDAVHYTPKIHSHTLRVMSTKFRRLLTVTSMGAILRGPLISTLETYTWHSQKLLVSTILEMLFDQSTCQHVPPTGLFLEGTCGDEPVLEPEC